MKILIFYFLTLTSLAFGQDEAALLQTCKQVDLVACEKLGAYYINKTEWEKAFLIGEMLCEKDRVMGCTFAGTSQLAMLKTKEGITFLNKACDLFEPYACRSMGRLMRKNNESALAYMYLKRACHYGLSESCSELRKPTSLYSPAGLSFIKKVHSDCGDTALSICQDHLALLNSCKEPLTKKDCLLLPGELSIYFRAKLMQSEARLSLLSLQASEKALKDAPNSSGYSYELSKVLKDFRPMEKYHYVFGFMKACRKKYGKKGWVTNSLELFPDSYKHLSVRIKANIISYFEKGKQDDCYSPTVGFAAFAVINLDPLNPTRLDVWKTNQDGNFFQVSDGLPLP